MMTGFQGIDWATPWAGLLALAPLLLFWLARRRNVKLGRWAEAHLQPWATSPGGAGAGKPWRRWLDVFAWCLLALAAAGPRQPLDAVPGADDPPKHVLDLMVVVDISASMAAADIAPDRLERASLELADLATRLHGERVGLIVYAGRAGLLLPPSDDVKLLVQAISEIDGGLIQVPGSNPVDALRLAADTLASAKARAVLLLTDAEAGNLAKTAVEPLRRDRVPLYVLGIATAAGAPIPLTDGGFAEQDGAQVISRPNFAAWRSAAEATGGRLAEVTDGDGDWRTLYDAGIARLPSAPVAPERARAWRQLYKWPLALALMLFMLSRAPRLLPVLLIALALPQPAHADTDTDTPYAAAMRSGVAAWQQRDYGNAAAGFNNALLLARDERERADALYDLGEAHYGLGHWQAAVEAFRTVLAMRPGDRRAAYNLAQAERQAKLHRNVPTPSDLRGRRGVLVEGIVEAGPDEPGRMEDSAPPPTGPINGQGTSANGATLTSQLTASQRIEADPRLLQSGLKKLDLIGDERREVLRSLLTQDTPPDAKHVELPPW